MGEQQNILSGLVQTGTVTAIDSAKRKARVKFKDTGIISGWLYVLQHYGADFYIEPDAKHTHEITDTFTGGGSAGEYRAELQDNDCGNFSADGRKFVTESGLLVGGNTLPNGEANFMWQDFLTREQFATVLYRFAQKFGLN